MHLGAVPDEAPFEQIAGPNLHGAFHVFEACRRAGVKRVVFASSNHATGMYPVGEPLDGHQPPRPDGLYGASKVFGEALGRMYVDRFGLSVVCLRIGSFQPRPRERRELATWISHADTVRLVRAALTADDVGFAIVYGASANTRRWWPPDDAIGYEPQDDAEDFADEIEGERGLPPPGRPQRGARPWRLGDVNADTLRARFDAPDALGIGIEEELFLLDGETLDLLPKRARGARAHARRPALQARAARVAAGDRHAAVPGRARRAVEALAAARRDLAAAAAPLGRLMTAGAHPVRGRARRRSPTTRATSARWTSTAPARAASSSPACTCTSRSAAPSARSRSTTRCARTCPSWPRWPPTRPSTSGQDTGLASIRPTIAVNLQRQGVPPAIESWEWFAQALSWGERSDTVPDARRWWFELRLHATYGTLELRVPDAQSSVDDVLGVAAFAYGLIHCARRPPRRRRDAAGGRLVADRREPLGGDARRRRRRRSRTSSTGERVNTRELLSARAGVAGARAGARAHARADRGQRRHPHP